MQAGPGHYNNTRARTRSLAHLLTHSHTHTRHTPPLHTRAHTFSSCVENLVVRVTTLLCFFLAFLANNHFLLGVWVWYLIVAWLCGVLFRYDFVVM